MIETLSDLTVGVIGFRLSGRLTRDEYHEMMRPIYDALDKDWIRHGVAVFGWLSPGELRVFDPGERDAAVAWVAAA